MLLAHGHVAQGYLAARREGHVVDGIQRTFPLNRKDLATVVSDALHSQCVPTSFLFDTLDFGDDLCILVLSRFDRCGSVVA